MGLRRLCGPSQADLCGAVHARQSRRGAGFDAVQLVSGVRCHVSAQLWCEIADGISFENLLYHEVLVCVSDGICPCSAEHCQSTFVFTRGPILPYTVVSAFSRPASDNLHTLTGVSLPLFCKMYRIAALVRQRRSKRSGKASSSASASGAWSDDGLVDMVRSAEELEAELAEEKKRMDALVICEWFHSQSDSMRGRARIHPQRVDHEVRSLTLSAKPNIASHRYLHEAYRTACLLSLRTFVLLQPPSSLNIRLLVRQSLSLLEAMCDQNLPGYCSSHWVLFCTAVCAVPGQQEEGEMDDRERVDRLYEDTMCVGLNGACSHLFIHDRIADLRMPLYRVERQSAEWEM